MIKLDRFMEDMDIAHKSLIVYGVHLSKDERACDYSVVALRVNLE